MMMAGIWHLRLDTFEACTSWLVIIEAEHSAPIVNLVLS